MIIGGIVLPVAKTATRKRGENTVTNTELLEQWIANSGKKKGFLAKKLGLSLAGFRNCCVNKAEFTARHIRILCEELGITKFEDVQAVFFACR